MGISRAYLDTYYLLEVVFEGVYKKNVEHLLSQISNRSFKVSIPQIVMGEAISQIFEKCGDTTRPDHLLERLASMMQKYKIGHANMPPPPNKSFCIMTDLVNVDDRLVGVDAVMLAHALADPDSKFLFTPDETLVENQNICNYELRLRHDGKRNTRLNISEFL